MLSPLSISCISWRRGMVLVPLDPHDPVSRLCHVVQESQASCLVAKDWGDAKKLAYQSEIVLFSLTGF